MSRKKTKFEYKRYTPEQLAAARMMCDPDKQWTNKEIAEEAGVTERTIYRWREDPEFIQLVHELNEQFMDLFAIEVYRALRMKVQRGDVKAIELAMKRMGVLIDKKEVQTDVNVQVEQIGDKSNEALLAEIREREKRLLGEVVVDGEFTDIPHQESGDSRESE